MFRVFYSPKVDKIIIWREREREKERDRERREREISIFPHTSTVLAVLMFYLLLEIVAKAPWSWG